MFAIEWPEFLFGAGVAAAICYCVYMLVKNTENRDWIDPEFPGITHYAGAPRVSSAGEVISSSGKVLGFVRWTNGPVDRSFSLDKGFYSPSDALRVKGDSVVDGYNVARGTVSWIAT